MSIIFESIFQDLYAFGIENFASEVFSLKKQGFKVYIQCPTELVSRFIFNNFKRLSKKYETPEEAIFASYNEINSFNLNIIAKPCILITSLPVESAWGFVRVPLPELNQLLPPTTKLVSHVLKKLMLDRYIDCFDATITQLVKRIADRFGLERAIDAIVQVALLAGFKGDESEARLYLERLLHQDTAPLSQDVPQAIVRHSQSPEDFFGQLLLKSSEPYTFLKVALSFYAVRMQGQSISRVSRHLNISRTTLINHLRLADELNVKNLFPSLSKNFVPIPPLVAKNTNRMFLSK